MMCYCYLSAYERARARVRVYVCVCESKPLIVDGLSVRSSVIFLQHQRAHNSRSPNLLHVEARRIEFS